MSAEHIIERLMASLVYSIALGMLWQSEDLLDPQGVQQLSPNIADELSAVVGEEPARSAEVWDHVAQEGFAHSVRGVIAGRNEDGIFRIAIHEHDEEFLVVIRRQRPHNVNGQRIPGTLRLDSTSRLLAMSIVAAQLTLGTILSGFEADAAAGFVVIPVAEELPQRLPTEVGGGVELSSESSGFLFILHKADLEEGVFWRRRVDW